jgi:hypothetical protein
MNAFKEGHAAKSAEEEDAVTTIYVYVYAMLKHAK